MKEGILMKGKVKVGLLLDSIEIPAWQYIMLEEVVHSDFASIDLLIVTDIAPSKNDGTHTLQWKRQKHVTRCSS